MRKALLFAAMLLAAVSCTKESEVASADGTTIVASISSVKTALGAKDGNAWANVWSAGDKLSVNGAASAALGAEAAGKAKASFTFGGALEAPYYVAYPADAVSAYSAGKATVTVPAEQALVAGTYDPAAFIMLGKTDGSHVGMGYAMALVHISITGEGKVASISLSGTPSDALSGQFTTDFSVLTAKTVANSVTAKSAEGVSLPADFFIAVPAGNYSSLVVKVVAVNGDEMNKIAKVDGALAAGQVYSTPSFAYAGAPVQRPETLKVLAIGNSFSADAVEQELAPLFAAAGQKVIIGDMYIGGCPLVDHASNATSDAAAYSYRKIVGGELTKTSSVKLSTALADENWDYISVQEGAGFHGFYNKTYNGTTHSMEPALTTLINYCKARCPGAKIIYHVPWAAQKGYTGTKFSYYGYDQQVMYNMICEATRDVLKAHPEIDMYINTMDAIQNGRSSYLGDTFNRDGWHLSYTIGRYTSGCIWFEKLMGETVMGNPYHPTTVTAYQAAVCQRAAHEAVIHPFTVTDLSKEFEKPAEEEDPEKSMKVLAKWSFSPARAVSDGYVKTWTGQERLGVYRYSNEAGERGYMLANEEGSGKLSYVQIDKTAWSGDNAGLQVFDVSNGGQPVMCGPMPGDYWLIETTGAGEIAEGSKLHVVFTYTPVSYGAKYWLIEYTDGNNWKPAFETHNTTISASSENIVYNKACTASKIEPVEFYATLDNPTREFKVRMTCCSTYQVNDKWFDHPNVKCVQRIAGDPANAAKPLPEIDLML